MCFLQTWVSRVVEERGGLDVPDMSGQVLTAGEAQGARRVVGTVEALRLLLLAGLVSVDAALGPVSTLVRRLHVHVLAVLRARTLVGRGVRYVLRPGRGGGHRLCCSRLLRGQGAKVGPGGRGRIVHAGRGERLRGGTRARSRGRSGVATLAAIRSGEGQHLHLRIDGDGGRGREREGAARGRRGVQSETAEGGLYEEGRDGEADILISASRAARGEGRWLGRSCGRRTGSEPRGGGASGSVRGERRGRAVLATGLGSVDDAGKETPLDQQRRRKEPARERTTVEEELGMGGRRREMRW